MDFTPRLGLVLVLAVIAVAALATTASASTQPAMGTFVEGPETILNERQSGGNLIIELTRAVVFSGTYTGAGQAHQRIVIHQDGSANVHMTITFSGLACGQPAQLEFLIVGQVTFDENFMGDIAGTYTVSTAARRSRERFEATANSRARRASAAPTREPRTATDASKGEGLSSPSPYAFEKAYELGTSAAPSRRGATERATACAPNSAQQRCEYKPVATGSHGCAARLGTPRVAADACSRSRPLRSLSGWRRGPTNRGGPTPSGGADGQRDGPAEHEEHAHRHRPRQRERTEPVTGRA